MAEVYLAAKFDKPDFPIVDHYTFVICGDGCLMEGISSEAFSLADTLSLGKLIILYDSNRITIEYSTDIAFTENIQQRVETFGFQTLTVEDSKNIEEIGVGIEATKADKNRPSFITVKTHIGFGSPKQEPLGEENIIALKKISAGISPKKISTFPPMFTNIIASFRIKSRRLKLNEKSFLLITQKNALQKKFCGINILRRLMRKNFLTTKISGTSTIKRKLLALPPAL